MTLDWQNIFRLANQDRWQDKTETVTVELRLAVNSLIKQKKNFWLEESASIDSLMKKNPGVKNIITKYSEKQIGYAIRLARM